jgi:hypothetical protein
MRRLHQLRDCRTRRDYIGADGRGSQLEELTEQRCHSDGVSLGFFFVLSPSLPMPAACCHCWGKKHCFEAAMAPFYSTPVINSQRLACIMTTRHQEHMCVLHVSRPRLGLSNPLSTWCPSGNGLAERHRCINITPLPSSHPPDQSRGWVHLRGDGVSGFRSSALHSSMTVSAIHACDRSAVESGRRRSFVSDRFRVDRQETKNTAHERKQSAMERLAFRIAKQNWEIPSKSRFGQIATCLTCL